MSQTSPMVGYLSPIVHIWPILRNGNIKFIQKLSLQMVTKSIQIQRWNLPISFAPPHFALGEGVIKTLPWGGWPRSLPLASSPAIIIAAKRLNISCSFALNCTHFIDKQEVDGRNALCTLCFLQNIINTFGGVIAKYPLLQVKVSFFDINTHRANDNSAWVLGWPCGQK